MGKSYTKNPTVKKPGDGPGMHNPHAVHPRDAIHDFDSPYHSDRHLPDDSVCTTCGAIYEKQRWLFDESRSNLLRSTGAAGEVTCPGCRMAADDCPEGVITLEGDYWPAHRDALRNLIVNEERRSQPANAMERILAIREEGVHLVIETTNAKLAQRIARAMGKAHGGHLEYQRSDEERLLRVRWTRALGKG